MASKAIEFGEKMQNMGNYAAQRTMLILGSLFSLGVTVTAEKSQLIVQILDTLRF